MLSHYASIRVGAIKHGVGYVKRTRETQIVEWKRCTIVAAAIHSVTLYLTALAMLDFDVDDVPVCAFPLATFPSPPSLQAGP